MQSTASLHANTRYVFDFSEGKIEDTMILGGKGAGLAHMAALGLPVPPGFTVSCRAGREFVESGSLPGPAERELTAHLDRLESSLDRRLGDATSPLLVSVRSGAPVSMPGMMDTVLNVGLNSVTIRALIEETGDEKFAWSCYERFLETYASVVRGVPENDVAECMMDLAESDDPATRSIALLALIEESTGVPVPEDPRTQISEAVEAVFRSWESPRAKRYRRFKAISDELCTAATVQAMVFGNRGHRSASGVAFTRDPSSGEPGAYGDVLFDAQGEDVVSGTRDAEPLTALKDRMPNTYAQLEHYLVVIERDRRDLCEVEFTVEDGTLWILQTRVGLRSGRAAVRTAVSLVESDRISVEEAIERISPAQLAAAAAPGLSACNSAAVIAVGHASSPGGATGAAVFDPARAAQMAAVGESVVLIRSTTSPSDVEGFIASRAIVTGRGGRTSHAAVVARGMHRPAVCGVGEVTIAADLGSATVNGHQIREGDTVSVDGDRGRVLFGSADIAPSLADDAVDTFRHWCAARPSAPVMCQSDAEGVPTVNDLADLDEYPGRVVISLESVDAIHPVALTAALGARAAAHPPLLKPTEPWLARADSHVLGVVEGVIVGEDSLGGLLMRSVLTTKDD